jgi:hypothetical protein
MSLYILSYVKNQEFRGNMVEYKKIPETIDMLKEYDIEVCYITKVEEDHPDIKKLLGIYKRTKKQNLRYKYINEIEHLSINLGNKPLTTDEFLKDIE